MLENFDNNVDHNLKLIAEKDSRTMFRSEFTNELGNRLRNSERFAELMEQEGLITIEPIHRERCDLTRLGYEIAKNGGWIKYKEAKELLAQKEKAEQNLREQTELIKSETAMFENKLSKWKVKTFWWFFIFAFFGFGLGIYNFINGQFMKDNDQVDNKISKIQSDLNNIKGTKSQTENFSGNKTSSDSLKK